MIRLHRTGERYVYYHDGERYEGVRGVLTISPLMQLHTVERGDGYVHLRPNHVYELEHAVWRSKSGATARALRVLLTEDEYREIYGRPSEGEAERGRMYIHPANWPHQIAGCIAPGLRRIDEGVGSSRLAMGEIWRYLGGYEAGARAFLAVS